MQAYLHLAHDAEATVKLISDHSGRIPVQEHFPELDIDGEPAYLIDWTRLDSRQRQCLAHHVAVRDGISQKEAARHCWMFGVPVGRSQGTAIEVMGDLHPLDVLVYAPESPNPFGAWDMDEVVAG